MDVNSINNKSIRKEKNMYSVNSFELTRNEFNYLLSVYNLLSPSRKKIYEANDRYYFIAIDSDELDDMLHRLKGLYDNSDEELKNMVSYHCFVEHSLNPFRESMGVMLLY